MNRETIEGEVSLQAGIIADGVLESLGAEFGYPVDGDDQLINGMDFLIDAQKGIAELRESLNGRLFVTTIKGNLALQALVNMRSEYQFIPPMNEIPEDFYVQKLDKFRVTLWNAYLDFNDIDPQVLGETELFFRNLSRGCLDKKDSIESLLAS